MAFDLASIRRGKSHEPPRVVVYGPHGIGKSTFAAGAPDVVFVPSEDGVGNLDVAFFPTPSSFTDVLDAIGALYDEAHEFRSVCLDTIDWIEALIWSHVSTAHNVDGIEGFGFGKGYTYAADEMRVLLQGLDALRRERGMTVILLAHTQVRRFDDPMAEPYDRYEMKLHKHTAALVQEWADIVGYAAEQYVVKQSDVGFGKKVSRAIESGERVLHVSRKPAFDAKNRYQLPDTLPLQWAALEAAIRGE